MKRILTYTRKYLAYVCKFSTNKIFIKNIYYIPYMINTNQMTPKLMIMDFSSPCSRLTFKLTFALWPILREISWMLDAIACKDIILNY